MMSEEFKLPFYFTKLSQIFQLQWTCYPEQKTIFSEAEPECQIKYIDN